MEPEDRFLGVLSVIEGGGGEDILGDCQEEIGSPSSIPECASKEDTAIEPVFPARAMCQIESE